MQHYITHVSKKLKLGETNNPVGHGITQQMVFKAQTVWKGN